MNLSALLLTSHGHRCTPNFSGHAVLAIVMDHSSTVEQEPGLYGFQSNSLLFVTVVPKYLNVAKCSSDLLAILRACPEFQ
jgi:hypothetical protein